MEPPPIFFLANINKTTNSATQGESCVIYIKNGIDTFNVYFPYREKTVFATIPQAQITVKDRISKNNVFNRHCTVRKDEHIDGIEVKKVEKGESGVILDFEFGNNGKIPRVLVALTGRKEKATTKVGLPLTGIHLSGLRERDDLHKKQCVVTENIEMGKSTVAINPKRNVRAGEMGTIIGSSNNADGHQYVTVSLDKRQGSSFELTVRLTSVDVLDSKHWIHHPTQIPKNQIVGHTFICHVEYTQQISSLGSTKSVTTPQGSLGWVQSISLDSRYVDCMVENNVAREIRTLPIACLRFGPVFGSWNVDHNYQTKVEARVIPVSEVRRHTKWERNDFRHDLAVLVPMLLNEVPRLTYQKPAYKEIILESEQGYRKAVDIISEGMDRAYSGNGRTLRQILAGQDRTLENIVKSGKIVRKGASGDGGIYIIVCSDFEKGSDFEGEAAHWYIGQGIDFGDRLTTHEQGAKSKNGHMYNSHHYRVRRAAKKVGMVRLCVIQNMLGGTVETARAWRDLVEQCFMLFLDSYSPSALQFAGSLTNGVTLNNQSAAQAVANSLGERALCGAFRDLMRRASRETGHAFPVSASELKGKAGLNFASPFGGEGKGDDGYEKILWTRVKYSDGYVFQRKGYKVTARKTGEILFAIKNLLGGFSFQVSIPKGEAGKDYPAVGDIVFVNWEVSMTGDHHTPYFRAPTSGMWTNWGDANKLGLKIKWFSEKDQRDYSRHVQMQGIQNYFREDQKGSQASFCQGAAMYAYFMRSSYKLAPEWFPTYGIADQVEIIMDGFNQKITMNVITDAVTDTSDEA